MHVGRKSNEIISLEWVTKLSAILIVSMEQEKLPYSVLNNYEVI